MASELPAPGAFAEAYLQLTTNETLRECNEKYTAAVKNSAGRAKTDDLSKALEDSIAAAKNKEPIDEPQVRDTQLQLSNKERHDLLTIDFILQQHELVPLSLRYVQLRPIKIPATPPWASSVGVVDCECERFVSAFEFYTPVRRPLCRLCIYTQIIDARFVFARFGGDSTLETFELRAHPRCYRCVARSSHLRCTTCDLKFWQGDRYYEVG